MTALEQLKLIKDERYVTADGREFGIILKEGLPDYQIEHLAARLPASHIPAEIRELLQFSSGFSFAGLGEISFDGVDQFGFENIFPASVQLAGDGAGNFWIVDINPMGGWGSVFFACHDPAVVIKQSEDLVEFLQQIDELGKKPEQSTLSLFRERTMMRVYNQDDGYVEIAAARSSSDLVLREFAAGLPDHFVIVDLRNSPIQTGFAWGKYGSLIDNAVRHADQLIWGFETKGKKAMRTAKNGLPAVKNGLPAAKGDRPWWKFWG
ncbi:MAG TPA: SMI1/KNR4 family protein [Puia sp.]|uniref:SMI1/KNR4 family protein n=1 Tax=Puia sp. TaxID=2045100 RepID=UPI002BC24D46|nr:SMI1/KNR4 family protein [Puia sp.]HVU96304.1 SMI1/KNR4 family protein [Puia sp.]